MCGAPGEGGWDIRCLCSWRLWVGRGGDGNVLLLFCVKILNVGGLCVAVGGRRVLVGYGCEL